MTYTKKTLSVVVKGQQTKHMQYMRQSQRCWNFIKLEQN